MARPKTPRRGFGTLIDGLAQIKRDYPTVQIRLFGEDLSRYAIPFAYEGLGIVVRRNDLAKLYSDADIFIDASDFQGFGRPALEAMACQTACVLTSFGGVGEYARDGVNAC
jgi:O-antigen biosynthesis protein